MKGAKIITGSEMPRFFGAKLKAIGGNGKHSQLVRFGASRKAQLVVMNIGDTFTTGPKEAAYVVNDLIKPASVIASHANEPATEKGAVKAGTRTATFIKSANMPVHVPLSGRTMAFDASEKCVDDC